VTPFDAVRDFGRCIVAAFLLRRVVLNDGWPRFRPFRWLP
jgi:hypothetical protein